METITLREHIDYITQCIRELRLSKKLFYQYRRLCEQIFLYCTENHLDCFGYQDAADYCEARCPSLKKHSVKGTTKIAYTIAAYFESGYFTWKYVTFTQYPVCRNYESLRAPNKT